MRTSFVLHIDSLCVLEKMSDHQAGQFMKAIYQYQKLGHLPDSLDALVEIAIAPFVNQFVRDDISYQKVCERNKKNGIKGGRKKPSRPQSGPKNPVGADNKSDNKSDSDSDSDISFEVFWDLYDKKVGDRRKLEKKWSGLAKEVHEKIIEYIPAYIKAQPDKKYRKDPQTFLNNSSWQDEIIEPGGAPVVQMNGLQDALKKAANWQPSEDDKW